MTFPSEMLVDYVRVYQRAGQTNIGCDPPDYPTADYINRHYNAYSGLCCSYQVTILCSLTVFSRRCTVAILDNRTRWRELFVPQEPASASFKFPSMSPSNRTLE
jgi:hypothetical protein